MIDTLELVGILGKVLKKYIPAGFNVNLYFRTF